jgi:hypothetical protein
VVVVIASSAKIDEFMLSGAVRAFAELARITDNGSRWQSEAQNALSSSWAPAPPA